MRPTIEQVSEVGGDPLWMTATVKADELLRGSGYRLSFGAENRDQIFLLKREQVFAVCPCFDNIIDLYNSENSQDVLKFFEPFHV